MDDRLEAGKAALLDRAAGLSRGRLDEEFLRQYWERVAAADIAGRDPVDLYGAALAHSRLAAGRPEGTPAVAVYTPVFEDHGWASSHSVVEAVTDDMPFLVDSVSLELSRRGVGMHLVAHPVIGGVAFIHVEIDRQADRAATVALAEAVARVLDGVRVVVDDWEPMRARALAVAAELEAHPPAGAAPDAVAEACDFLRWAADDRFVFMGYRRPGDGDGGDEGDGLGLFRPGRGGPAEDRLTPEPGGLLVLTRSEHDSPVHRPGALDVIAVGDQRFVGLYTSVLQKAPTTTIPVVRRTVAAVIERAGFAPGGHDAKALVDVLEAYPRRELFELDAGELYETATGILALSQRQRVRLFARRDRYRRFWSCLVFVPLDRYTQAVRRRITDVLMADLAGTGFEYSAQVGDSVLVRLHFVIHTPDGAARPDLDLIESRVAEAARSWTDDLSAAFLEAHGEEAGLTLLARYADAFPPGYRDDVPARVTVADAERVEQLAGDADIGLALTHPVDSPDGTLRFKVFRRHHPVPLSDVMPILENMGVSAVDQRPYEIKPAGAGPVWLHDFGLRTGDGRDVVVAELRGPFTDAFAAVWRGDAENDGFNRLVAAAGLDWREVSVLRAYARYLRQVGTAFSQGYMETALIANPHISRLLVELFRARFDPVGQPDPDDAASVLTKRLEAGIDAVASLDEDRILRSFLALVQATVRTNFFAGFAHGSLLAFKFDPQGVPGMPLPRPRNEIFVCSPTVEGTHLRGGKVSRGGIRWSDRREDFRTEILGLMKAQMVKNTVIVPVGAKGGFVVKSPVAPGGAPGPPTPSRERVAECYRAFVSGLLELTDNNVAGEVVCPAGVVAYDSDDPYLVVAADKGTATFSDLANEVAAEAGFWLGDAFASGGSSGYDHKKMGITARGAWESVRRHFRHLGVDAAAAPLTVAGIGDMSGDVFGNGMLCSPHLRLVAAFDHRHVFFDPDPDAAAAYAERRRLFVLGRSSWADYDTSRISPGGGVFPRTAKSIPLSPEVRAVLDTDAATLPPNEVVRAILAAPVDLLWNGGIGTYVKASTESHADAGDKSNDPVRIDATEVRASVVAEGGNLGFTQRARVEYAIAGGRIHTDAIDNSAGVDCSDHEVNIKILLDAMVADGDLTTKQRNQLLTEMADDVAALVLADNYAQTGALAMALTQAPEMAGVHMRYMRRLEGEGRLNRALEFLPSDEALTARRAATGLGLVAPEFAVLLAYTKLEVAASLGSGDAADDPWLGRELTAYFPPALRDGRFAEAMARHPLRREIVAARVTNTLVDRAGTSFVHRLTEETGAPVAELARAHAAAREMYGLDGFWTEIEGLDTRVRPEIQLELALEGRRLAERATRWLVRHQPAPLPVAHLVDGFSAGVAEVERRLPDLVPPSEREAMEEAAARWEADGVTAGLAARAAVLRHCHCALDIVEVARGAGHPVEGTAAAWYALGSHLELDWLRSRVVALPRDDRWQALARGALRDDCDGLRAALTTATLGTAGGVEGWVAEHRPAVWRFLAVLDEIRSVTAPDCASLSVAMRELRAVLAGG